MPKEAIRFLHDACDSDAEKLLLQRVAVDFDTAEVAAVAGVSHADLIARMLRILARALACDAAAFADAEMRMTGKRFGADGFPDGWPVQHLAAVVVYRLFPELQQ